MLDNDELRSAFAQFATGVTIITTLDDEGQPHSMTANAFSSICLDPPTVMVCIAHGTHTHGYLEKTSRFGVNILKQEQQDLGAYFAKKPEDRDGGVEYHYSEAGDRVPVLDGSMVFFGCQVLGSHVYGDHTIYIGEVKEMRRSESGAPLMFYNSRWYNPAEE
ncbi:MAG: flavin reductase family protein [Chloroflexi bacterium]|nr:flavin reductase family protein [Chloroflexota bacterium]MCI0789243.1 flavin reductase family protein [Chloroflexota bacterium]MCI0802543.1 flavin reductase family protein [Chloroflexota bacterium]MCI0809949.1 flavin reductase family protein [Chloroflexota bacterium]MCI0830294.1 flavin reductase family protein [Chloroflexota bacterium]